MKQVFDQGLQKHGELGKQVNKLQQEKAKAEGRTNDEDVNMGNKQGEGHQGSKAGTITDVFEDTQSKW